MKRWICNIMILFALITGVLGTPVICHAEEKEMVPVYGEDIKDGTYSIEVESSSSMFRIVDAQLTITEGEMMAVITLSGTGYLKLFMGTGEQALAAEEIDYIPFVENEEGAYTYTIPVEVLNQEFECTAFSRRRERWYDRQLVFLAETLPQEALLKPLVPVFLDKKDGEYTIEASLTGGSGRANIISPMPVTITENIGTASLQWDSPYYDYMIVNGEKIYPSNTEGNSAFEIPVWVLDQEMLVIADTTAMSVPHEIEYMLTFYSDTLKPQGMGYVIIGCIVALAVCSATFCAVKLVKKKKKVQNA